MSDYDPNYNEDSKKILFTEHDEVIEHLKNFQESLEQTDMDVYLDFELEYEEGGALQDLFKVIEIDGSLSRSYVIQTAFTLNLIEVLKEEFIDLDYDVQILRKLPSHFEMRIPTSGGFNYGKLYVDFEELKERFPIDSFTVREGSLREVLKQIIN